MEIELNRYEIFPLHNGTFLYLFNYKELGLDEVNEGDIVIIKQKKHVIEGLEYMKKSFDIRGDNVLVKLKEL